MPEQRKLLEISGESWLKGISAQSSIIVGGLFQKATNFDPFEKVGVWLPNKTPTRYGNAQVTEDITSFVVSSSSGASGVFIHAFAVGGTLYRIDAETGTVVDETTRLDSNNGATGSIVYKNKTIFANNISVFAHDYPPSAITGNIVTIMGMNSTQDVRCKFHIGPDRNLYMTNGRSIARITSVTGTTDNVSDYLQFETGVETRSIDDDGVHLVIVGDMMSTGTQNVGGLNRCFVAFWNMKSQELTRMWEFTDERLFGVASLEDEVLIFGKNNVYTCSVSSRIKILMPLRENSCLKAGLLTANSVIKKNNSVVLWGAGTSLRGYGRIHPSLPKTFFTAYTVPDHTGFTNILALAGVVDANTTFKIWAGTDGSQLYAFDAVSTETSTTTVAGIDFKQPYEFSFAKVILAKKLSSGQSVDFEIKTN